MARKILHNLRCCWSGHKWGEEDWQYVEPGLSFYWFRACERCGKKRLIAKYTTPPSHFVLNEYGVMQEVLNEK